VIYGFCLSVKKFGNLAVKQHGAIDHTYFVNTDSSIRHTSNTFLTHFLQSTLSLITWCTCWSWYS